MESEMKSTAIRDIAMASALAFSGIAFPLPSNAQNSPQWKGTITKEGDVVVVRNPKEPIYESKIFELKEELSLGGGQASGETAFFGINDIGIDGLGNIYIVDLSAGHILKIDKNGKFLRTIGRKGQGPGEFQMLSLIFFAQDGKTFRTFDNLNHKLSQFSLDGDFITADILPSGTLLHAALDSQGRLYVGTTSYETRRIEVQRYDGSMKSAAKFGVYPLGGAENSEAPHLRWTIDSRDEVVIAYPLKYELLFFSYDGRLIKKVTKTHNPVKLTEEEKKDAIRSVPKTRTPNVQDYHSAYQDLFVDDEGRTFVKTWERADAGAAFIYDIFDPDGRFLARCPLQGRPFHIKKRKLYSVERDSDDFQTVKRYAVLWTFPEPRETTLHEEKSS